MPWLGSLGWPKRDPPPPSAVSPAEISFTMLDDSVDRSEKEYSGRTDANTR